MSASTVIAEVSAWAEFRAWSTLALATLGAVTGTIAFLRQFMSWRVRLRVTAYSSVLGGTGGASGPRLSVNIVNRSGFPLFISNVSICLRDSSERGWAPEAFCADGQPIRRQLREREAFTVIFPEQIRDHPRLQEMDSVVVYTDCGKQVLSDRHGVRGFVKSIMSEGRPRCVPHFTQNSYLPQRP